MWERLSSSFKGFAGILHFVRKQQVQSSWSWNEYSEFESNWGVSMGRAWGEGWGLTGGNQLLGLFRALFLFSGVWLFATPRTAAHQASLTFTILGVCLNSCSLSRWGLPVISSSVTPFSSCPQPVPSESFPVSQLFTWSGQSTGASGSVLVLLKNIQSWFPLGLTDLISL